jgi:hypothetical protein
VGTAAAFLIEIASRRPQERIFSDLGGDVFKDPQGFAPEAILRQRADLPASGPAVRATGRDRSLKAAHALLQITVSEFHIGKNPEQICLVRRCGKRFRDYTASLAVIPGPEELRSAPLSKASQISRNVFVRPINST